MSSLNTQLFEAVRKGNAQRCLDLLACGADVNAKGNGHWSPLLEAARYNQAAICQLLLEHGASVDRADAYQNSALHWAAANDCAPTCLVLLAHGANGHAGGEAGVRPLHMAASMGSLLACLALLEHGVDPLIKDDKGQSAADTATANKKDACAGAIQSFICAQAARTALAEINFDGACKANL